MLWYYKTNVFSKVVFLSLEINNEVIDFLVAYKEMIAVEFKLKPSKW